MHRSGGLWGIVQQHGVALHGLLGISELTPCAQKRREAGRPVRADMAPDDPVLLRWLTRMVCLSVRADAVNGMSVRVVYTAHARAPSLAAQTGQDRV